MTSTEERPAPPLPRPDFGSSNEYGARLGDAEFWAPYVSAVLRRHRLPDAPLTVGTVGSFPTFLVGSYVVKLFGERFEGTAWSTPTCTPTTCSSTAGG